MKSTRSSHEYKDLPVTHVTGGGERAVEQPQPLLTAQLQPVEQVEHPGHRLLLTRSSG
jgi:hypothetical protein